MGPGISDQPMTHPVLVHNRADDQQTQLSPQTDRPARWILLLRRVELGEPFLWVGQGSPGAASALAIESYAAFLHFSSFRAAEDPAVGSFPSIPQKRALIDPSHAQLRRMALGWPKLQRIIVQNILKWISILVRNLLVCIRLHGCYLKFVRPHWWASRRAERVG